MSDYRVIVGDCREVLAGMETWSVDAIITDPPYNAINRATGGLRSLDKGSADSLPVDIDALAPEFARVAAGSIYAWCSDERLSTWLSAFHRAGMTTRTGVWWKTNPSPMNGEYLWLSAVEVCAFARHDGAYFARRCAPAVWRGPTQTEVDWHPTPKPVWLMRELVTASVPEGGIVLDPFMGSGSVGVACRLTGRRFVGIEINPEWAANAEARIKRIDARPLSLFGPDPEVA